MRAVGLIGRHSETSALAEFIDDVRSGRSRVLVLCGEPGAGKTALLEWVVEQTGDCQVLRAAGVQAEMELAYAGLHQLLAPTLPRLHNLPSPQRDALQMAFGLRAGAAPDRFFIALAVLSLLADTAKKQPLICLVDDEQWLDRASAQTLAFVARRLGADSVGLIFAARIDTEELSGLPELHLQGLDSADARALLDSALTAPLDPSIRDRIVSETRGNPLALLELPRGVTSAELAGGFALPDVMPIPGRIEESYLRRLDAMPSATRRLLQLAAADPVGEPSVLWDAATRLGIDAGAAAPAIEAGLIEFGTRVQFRHPLVRSAAYRSASLAEKQSAHRALAEATDPRLDPDRRAWHRAQGAPGPDETVAVELENSADRALARGGMGAEIGTGTVVQQGHELLMKLGGAGSEGLELLTVVAEQCRDRRRYLVSTCCRQSGRGRGRGRSGLAKRRTDSRQVVGRRLNKLRRGDYKRQRCSFLGNPASDCGTRHATARLHAAEGATGRIRRRRRSGNNSDRSKDCRAIARLVIFKPWSCDP